MPVGVVMSVFNRREVLDRTISALLSNPPDGPIVVVDDGSTDGARSVLLRYTKRVRVVFNPKNLGLCGAANVGFSLARQMGATDVVRINSDILVMPGWFKSIRKVSGSVRGVGIVGPVYHDMKISRRRWRGQLDLRHLAGCAKSVEVKFVSGHVMFISDKMLSSGFRWDERFYPVGPCDIDAACFSMAHGFRNMVALGAHCRILETRPAVSYHTKNMSSDEFIYQKWPQYLGVLKSRAK